MEETNEELIKAIKEIFFMTRKSLNELERDIESKNENTKRCALYYSKLFISALLDVRDKLKSHEKNDSV